MVKSDSIVETHHFRRVIELKKGPVLKSRKTRNSVGENIRLNFVAKQISIFWRANEPVDYVIVYGCLVDDKEVGCSRRYEPRKIPKEILAYIGEDLQSCERPLQVA